MSILKKLANLKASSATAAKTPMTDDQVVQCKAALKRDNRGYNVHANKFDISLPYRVAINYNDVWDNYGNFKSADVAAAVGAVVSAGYFGEDARAGTYDATKVEASEEFKTWLADERNAEIIARANGDMPKIHGTVGASPAENAPNPF